MAGEHEYFRNKRTDRIYITSSFPDAPSLEKEKQRKMRILSKIFDSNETHHVARIKKEDVIRITEGKRQEIKAIFYEDNRDIQRLVIQKFTKKNGSPHQTSFSFDREEIEKIYNILRLIKYIDLPSGEKERLDDYVMDEFLLSIDEKKKYFLDNLELVEEIAKTEITKSDITALAYRKEQLNIFHELLDNSTTSEGKWQEYFENNPWIFGYGLNYIFATHLDNAKLEQVTSGHTFFQGGKRVDALLKTLGYINSLCFVEIKTHTTPLLAQTSSSYRVECWSISSELAGSISQIQKAVQKVISKMSPKIEMYNNSGNPTGEILHLYQPKSYIVIGSLKEFSTKTGISEQKYSSFEIFRNNMVSPEILTFDELYERAKCIVKHSEGTDTEKENAKVPF